MKRRDVARSRNLGAAGNIGRDVVDAEYGRGGSCVTLW